MNKEGSVLGDKDHIQLYLSLHKCGSKALTAAESFEKPNPG